MKSIVLMGVALIVVMLGGCSLFEADFSNAEELLAEIRDIDSQYNDMADFLPQKVDESKVAGLFKQFNEKEQLGKHDKSLMVNLNNELQKSVLNNQYKLQYLSKLLKKTAAIETKKQNIEKILQPNATDIVNSLKKQYKAEQQLITHYIKQETNVIKYLESKIDGKIPQPYQNDLPPINPDAPNIYQSKVYGEIKLYENKLDMEKDKNENWLKYRLKEWGIIG